ncbi:MAG: hypothetical protein ACR2PL_23770 [Dehalococcoidia bacterium]
MNAATVHQTLHGYRRGHELLAGSVRLPPAVADLVTRLSDLSGSMASGWEFTSYLTGYPLSGAGYFALARTWEDKNAARAGCVLTHTLLIPIDVWRVTPDPRVFSDHFTSFDELRSEERFKKSLQLDIKMPSVSWPVSLPHGTAVDFVRKYYGEGHRPLAWFDCPDPEGTAWAVVRILWPALREQFSWCTASMQPRSLDSRLLDLQFAPWSAYPRFHKIPRENFIAAEPETSGQTAEPWCVPCAQWIFSGHRLGPVDAEIRAFGPILREDPTLMRNLFLARDLSERVDSSPTAGAGLLDVTDALAPGRNQAVDYKARAARKAVDAAMAVAPDEALKCLFLVGERLMNGAFQGIAEDLGPELAASVDKLSSRHVREALLMPERVVSRVDVTITPYFQGVVQGLTRCAKETPTDLICLREFDKITPHLIAASPPIAGGYLRGLRSAGGSQTGRDALSGWITRLDSPALRHSLREELLPEVRDDIDVALVEQLCQNLPPEDVGSSLSVLAKGTDGFAPEKVLATLQEVVAGPHSDAVRAWAVPQKQWHSGVVSLVSATFPADASGFGQVVGFDPGDGKRRAALLTSFLGSCTSSRVPGWLKDATRKSADWLAPMLSLGDEISPLTSGLLQRLLPELRDVPVASRTDLQPVMASLSRFPFWASLVDLTLRNAVTGFVEAALSEEACRAWFFEAWALGWANEVSHGDLVATLIHPVSDRERRERAFRWLAFAPSALYERHASLIPDVFWELVSERRFGWTPAMGSAWADAIRRVQRATPGSTALRMCADILQFGFDHTGDPVGAVMAAAFYPVYRAVCDSNWTPPEVSHLLGWFDWDKAKELRKGLVRAFLGSNWSPGDLALSACEDEQLLRKLVKRTLRSYNGEQYVTLMLNDLAGRVSSGITRTVEIVRDLASNPDFYEPWD